MKNIALLFSGGVDSSVSLSLLKEQNNELTAFYLKIWLEDELSYLGNCPWNEDLEYVKKTCNLLNVKLEVISMQQEYKNSVIEYTINEIKKGNTPNPDVFCNKNIKLGYFFDKFKNDFNYFATGHYAKRIIKNDKFYLGLTADEIKDQTYFLAYTPLERLNKTLFPIGDMKKNEVREYAIKKNLPSAERKDSQGICFLGNIKFSEFIKYHCGTKIGKMIEFETGKILGEHGGFWFYTIGQRQGIGLSGGPWYVVKKKVEENLIYLSKKYYEDTKIRNYVVAKNINWLIEDSFKPKLNHNLKLKLRHGKNFNIGTLIKIDEINNEYHFLLSENDQGLSSGQFLALYSENIIENETICLGSGIIDNLNV